MLLGENPLYTQKLWYEMYRQTRDSVRKGSVAAGISAIDIALWDIAGQYYSQPIHQLLGGAFRSHVVVPYATGFYRVRWQKQAERPAAEARDHRAAGFTAMKIKLEIGLADDIEVMEAIHDAIVHCDIELMVDTNHAYGHSDALLLGKTLETYNVRWYEESVLSEDIEGYRELRSRLSVPIAGGENRHTAYGFRALIGSQAIDVAQPDISSCGGFFAARDIAALAPVHGVMVNYHVWGSAIAQAASVQLIAALPITNHSLFPREPVLE